MELVTNCQNCHKNFGIDYQYITRPSDLNLTSSLDIASLSIRTPFRGQSCQHKLCDMCVNNLICPVCHTQTKFQVDEHLLGQITHRSDLNHFIRLNYDLSDFCRLRSNHKNELAVKHDLTKRFLLRCDHCIDNYFIHKELFLAEKSSIRENFESCVARTYCFNCLDFYCDACYRRYHDKLDNEAHTAIQLQTMQDMPCIIHNNVMQYYSPGLRKLVCNDCIISASPICNDFVEIIKKSKRLGTLTTYKREFQKCKQSLRNNLDHANNSLNSLTTDNNKNNKSVDSFDCETRNRCVESIREIKSEISELEQSLFIAHCVLGELDFLSTDINNLLIKFYNDNKFSIEIVLNDYLKLIATANRPYIPRPVSPDHSITKKNFNKNWNQQKKNNSSKTNKRFSSFNQHRQKGIVHTSSAMSLDKIAAAETAVNYIQHQVDSTFKYDQNNNKVVSKSKLKNSIQIEKLVVHNLQKSNKTQDYDSTSSNINSLPTTEYYDTEDELVKPCPNPPCLDVNINDLQPGFTSKCIITLSKSIDSIYFRLIGNESRFQQMEKNLLSHCQANIEQNQFTEKDIKKLSVGDIVGVNFKNCWVRAQITQLIDESEDDPTTLLADLFAIDYGNEFNRFNLNQVKKLTKICSIMPGFVFKGCIHNLTPVGMKYWPDCSNKYMRDWFLDKSCQVEVTILAEITSDFYFGVDFSYKPDIMYDGYVSKSLSKTLIKAQLAELIQGNTEEYLQELTRQSLTNAPKYINMQVLHQEQKLTAGVTNFKLLDKFQMKQLFPDEDFEKSLGELRAKMKRTYERTNGDNKMCLVDPVVGLPVAALYIDNTEKMWCRAEITKIHPGTCTAEVYYVDFGNRATLQFKHLRYLTDQFFIDEVMVFDCRLYGIEFNDSESLQTASNFFYDKIVIAKEKTQKTAIIHVKKIVVEEYPGQTRPVYEIIIRFDIDQVLTNINILMTKRSYASVTDMAIYEGETKPVKKKKSINIMKEPTPSKLELLAKELKSLPNKVLKETPERKILCKVTNAFSPEEIWVQDVTDAEGCYEQFQELLCHKYLPLWEETDIQITKNNWKPGDLCVIKSQSRRNEFYRARITNLTGDTFSALYLDIGSYHSNIESCQVFRLLDEVADKPEFKAKKCRLIGVKPAGTTNGEWSNLAKTLTAEALNDTYVHVEFIGKRASVDQPYDICIYVDSIKRPHHEFQLNKNTYSNDEEQSNEFIRFADILNHKGLAFLDEKQHPLNRLIENSLALKAGHQVPGSNSYQNYLKKANLPDEIYQKSVSPGAKHPALVTDVNLKNGEVSVQFYKYSNVQRELSEMAQIMAEYYSGIGLQSVYSVEFISEVVKKKQCQACVAKVKGKFYRCQLVDSNKIDEYLLYSIDYGFNVWVQISDIYRPMLCYLDTPPHVHKFTLFLTPYEKASLIKNHYQILNDHIYNQLVTLKIIKITSDTFENVILKGDLFSSLMNSWAINYLTKNDSKSIYEHSMILNEEVFQSDFKPFNLPIDEFSRRPFKANIMWEKLDSKLIWLHVEIDPKKFGELAIMEEYFVNESESIKQRPVAMEQITLGMPCCSIYESILYRAAVKDFNFIENTATVQFVDYGNVEIVKLEEIFELDQKLLEFSLASVCCQIGELRVDNDLYKEEEKDWKEELLTASKDQSFFVVLKNKCEKDPYELEADLFIVSSKKFELKNLDLESLLEYTKVVNIFKEVSESK